MATVGGSSTVPAEVRAAVLPADVEGGAPHRSLPNQALDRHHQSIVTCPLLRLQGQPGTGQPTAPNGLSSLLPQLTLSRTTGAILTTFQRPGAADMYRRRLRRVLWRARAEHFDVITHVLAGGCVRSYSRSP